MTGLLLHLAGPLQSWGVTSPWNRRDTHDHPTRSGLIGLLAAATGYARGTPLDDFDPVEFTIRIDRPGQHTVDFHTVGGGRRPQDTPPLAGGGRRPAGRGTIVSDRHYLTDAAFTVAVTSTDPAILDRAAGGLRQPVYTPYLGRRSCPPASLLFLGHHEQPIHALHHLIPLARPAPRDSNAVAVDFVTEHPPPNEHLARTDTIPTRPTQFGEHRTYQEHHTWRYTHHLPADLCAGLGVDYLNRLTALNGNADAA